MATAATGPFSEHAHLAFCECVEEEVEERVVRLLYDDADMRKAVSGPNRCTDSQQDFRMRLDPVTDRVMRAGPIKLWREFQRALEI